MNKYCDAIIVAFESFWGFNGEIFSDMLDTVTTYLAEDFVELWSNIFPPQEEVIIGSFLLDDEEPDTEIEDTIPEPIIEQSSEEQVVTIDEELIGASTKITSDVPVDWQNIDTKEWIDNWFSAGSTKAEFIDIENSDKKWPIKLEFYTKIYMGDYVRMGDDVLKVHPSSRSLFAARVTLEHDGQTYDKVLYHPHQYYLIERQKFMNSAMFQDPKKVTSMAMIYSSVGMFNLSKHVPHIYESLQMYGIKTVVHLEKEWQTAYFNVGGLV